MAYILVALMYLDGDLRARIVEHDSRNACETAAQALRATYPDAAAVCLALKAVPT